MNTVTTELSQEIIQASLSVSTPEELIDFFEKESLKFSEIEKYKNVSVAFDTAAYIARLRGPNINTQTKQFLFELKDALIKEIFNMKVHEDIKRGWAIAVAVILEMQAREILK